jgi:cytochrome c oxidase subunit IV
MGQNNIATFHCILDSLSQLGLMGSGIISLLRLMVAGIVFTATFHDIWERISDTFVGSYVSISQLRLIVCGTVYHSYVRWYF